MKTAILSLAFLTVACAQQEVVAVPQSECSEEFAAHISLQPLNLPIEIRLNDNMPAHYQAAMREGAEFWNQELGQEAFTVVVANEGSNENTCGVAWVEMGKTPEPKFGGWTINTSCNAHVTITEDQAKFEKYEGYLQWIAKHELGHVLNLQHDDHDESNLMAPYYSSKQDLHLNKHSECWTATVLSMNDGDASRLVEFQ